jgi:hypothetical protein
MCDYSLSALPNRLAVEGEPLVVHRFRTGTMGLAAPAEIAAAATERYVPTRKEGWWSALKTYFTPRSTQGVCAVCVPPGARLLLRDIPERLQHQYQVGEVEGVIFMQVSGMEYQYRDAVRFANGQEVLLQRLEEGQRVEVLCLSVREELELPQVRGARIGRAKIRG